MKDGDRYRFLRFSIFNQQPTRGRPRHRDKMRNLTTFILFLLAFTANARQISPDEAAAIASDFLNSSSLQIANARRIGVKRARAKSDTDGKFTSPYYVFNGEGNQGFVIISGDDRAKKILGYSDTGNFDFDNLPPQLAAMLDQYAEQIASLPESAATDPSWSAPPRDAATEEGKLLETANWGQGYPYNAQCPVIDGVQCPTGCVATAMAIVMKYHNWPKIGNGKHTHAFNEDLSFDYDNYSPNWNQMPSIVTQDISEEQKVEISKLLLSAGISIDVQYSPSESGADITFLGNILSSRFNFAPTRTLYKNNTTDEDWNNIIMNELDNDRIILYRGAGKDNSSHEFIIDGYSNDNLYHVNWGWDGKMNCYVNIGNITIGNFDFSTEHVMVVGIEPNTKDIRYSSFVVNDSIGPLSDIKNSGFNFSADRIETGVPFHVVFPIVYGNPDDKGLVALALTNESDEIIEIISNGNGCDDYIEMSQSHSVAAGLEAIYSFECGTYKLPKHVYIYNPDRLVIKSEIKPGYKLQLIGRDSPNSKWEFIASSNKISTTVKLNQPIRSEWIDVRFEYDKNYFTLRSIGFFNTNEKALKDAVGRWDFVYGGGGRIIWDKSSTLPLVEDDGCTASIAYQLLDDIEYHAKVEYIPDRKVYSENIITENQTIVNGIVYEIDKDGLHYSEPNTSAKVVGFTSECPENVTIADTVKISGKSYPVKYVITGAFAGNKNIKHFNICTDLYFLDGALSYMSNLESMALTTKHDCQPDGGRFLLHMSNKIKNVYEKGTAYDPWGLAQPQANEWLNQHVFSEWEKYGISPNWYIENPSTRIVEPLVCISESKNPPHFYIPGQAVNANLPPIENVEITEMWKYRINRNMKSILIQTDSHEIDIDVEKVIINGTEYKGTQNGVYPYPKTGEAEVIVCYVLNGQQAMTTRYDKEFNASLPDLVKSLVLSPDSWSGTEGETFQITATVMPDNATNKTIVWTSSNEDIAIVDGNGNVSTHAVGEATITASATDGSGVSASCHVTVNPVLVESMTLSQEKWNGKVGESLTLSTTIFPDNATYKAIVWTSDSEDIATVSPAGVITAVAPGEATITASATDGSGVSATCHVTVNPVLVESLALSPNSWSGTEGETFQITATVMPDNATYKTIVWTTSDAAVATVDSAGMASVLKAGLCVIMAFTVDGSDLGAECIITSASGIDSMFADGVKVDVYNANGVLLKRGCGKTELKSLAPGVYIVRDKKKAKTIMIY